ncbi:hypothetical protein ACJDT4_16220 [Clostridium neuense]|uniref:Uncharacterized protein n=1 Tax=Clostridium neuense TaxID=1728934 RepID=A0ABW8TIE6_9CLOT
MPHKNHTNDYIKDKLQLKDNEIYPIELTIEKLKNFQIVSRPKKWFKLIPKEENEIYYKKLEEFLSYYDKKPNKKVQLYYKK